MNPIVHPVVGYLCYSAYSRLFGGSVPAKFPTLVAVGAAVLPDLIDQTLYRTGITPVGRTVGHSLLFAVPVVFAVWVLTRRRSQVGVAFAIGYLSHIAADIPWHVLAGDFHELGFLLWPITPMPAYEGTKPITTVAGLEITTAWPEALLLIGGVALWWRDGRPGPSWIRSRIT